MFVEKMLGNKWSCPVSTVDPNICLGSLPSHKLHQQTALNAVLNLRIFCFCLLTTSISSKSKSFLELVVVQLINPLNPELNPICYLLALLGAHHFLHVSRIRVKLLTFRLLMSYIYIYIYDISRLRVNKSHNFL